MRAAKIILAASTAIFGLAAVGLGFVAIWADAGPTVTGNLAGTIALCATISIASGFALAMICADF